ncbi:PPA5 phosphatase, partial [Nycticryphes semicollaris]|nr:PPA5 phosphatase [Nycticryphes semicollaris]
LWTTMTVTMVAGGGPEGAIQFLAVGDWGGVPDPPFATPREVATAAAMGRAATNLGADFVLALGDNFYYEGVRDEWDPRFQVTTPPSPGHFPHYCYSLDLLLGCPQVSPSLSMSHRHFPHHYYSLRLSLPGTNASARLLVLDTVLLCGGGDDFGAGGAPTGPLDAGAAAAQLAWLRGRLAAARHDRYVLVAGHYPVWSVAEHGPTACLVQLLRPLLRRHHVTAYLCGHDHNLQFLAEGGVGYVVSGAGNFMEESQQHRGAVPPSSLRFFFGTPTSPGGFAHLRLDAHAATITFLEATGRVLYRVALPPR